MIFLAYLLVFIFIAPVIALMFVAFRSYERSKRAVIEGMAELDQGHLDKLGWTPRTYISTWDFRGSFKQGWQSWGLLAQQQNIALQRVLLHGLPSSLELSDETQKSARRFRRYFCAFFVVGAVVVFLPAYFRLSRVLAEFTGVSAGIWYILFGLCIGSLVFLPLEKFKKWPVTEDTP